MVDTDTIVPSVGSGIAIGIIDYYLRTHAIWGMDINVACAGGSTPVVGAAYVGIATALIALWGMNRG